METKKIFEETAKLHKEINRLNKKIKKYQLQCLKMRNLCPHEIVFKYSDNYPRKMMKDGSYFCPACGKNITFVHQDQLKNSVFKNSKVIPLTDLSLLATDMLYYTIREEVYLNRAFYYNSDISIEELSKKMITILKNQECDYNKILSKRK